MLREEVLTKLQEQWQELEDNKPALGLERFKVEERQEVLANAIKQLQNVREVRDGKW